jgi:hypothetical protein
MTKKELIEKLKDFPDESEIDIYDLKSYTHPSFKVNTESYFNYDDGLPIITIELNGSLN